MWKKNAPWRLGKHREKQNVSNFYLFFYVISFFMVLYFRLIFFFFPNLCFSLTSLDSAGSRRWFLCQNTVKQTRTYSGLVSASEPRRQTVTDITGCRVRGCEHAREMCGSVGLAFGGRGTRRWLFLARGTWAVPCTPILRYRWGLRWHLPCVRMLITEMLSSWKFYYNNPFVLLRSVYSPSIWPTV